MGVEKRRYRIKGFREDGDKIRVLLAPEIGPTDVKVKEKVGMGDFLTNPMGIAQQMMNKGMQNIIHDSFSISAQEYNDKKYMVGETITVTMERE